MAFSWEREKTPDPVCCDYSRINRLMRLFWNGVITSNEFWNKVCDETTSVMYRQRNESSQEQFRSFSSYINGIWVAALVPLRDVFGNPFRPVTANPRWLTSIVVDLAKAIDNEKAFDKMPILADALMDAGCDSEDMLNHCRSGALHYRGCWVVDLVLGKQ